MVKLSKSNDEQLLYTIYDLLKDESKQSLLVLGNAQIMAIKIAEEEVAEGKVLTDIEVRKRTGEKGY